MTASAASAAPRRLLVRGVNWLGDAVMTTPALQRLRAALPDSHLTLLTHQKLAELWQHHPSLDAVVTFAPGEGLGAVARRLRAQHYASALVLPNSPRSALEVWLAGIPQRIGYQRRWRNWLLTQTVAPRPNQARLPKRSVSEVKRLIRGAADVPLPAAGTAQPGPFHQIHEYLHLTAALGANPEPLAPRLEITAAEAARTAAALLPDWRPGAAGAASGQPGVLLGLNPGAEYGPAKRWPAANFGAVAREVSRKLPNCRWLVFGGPGERQLGDEIARLAGGGVLNLAGQTSLRQLMALLKLCRVVVTNDTGPMHVAAALGTPVVVPFGSTSPELTGPGLAGDSGHRLLKSAAPCSPCFRRTCPIDFRCMTGIRPEHVVEAVLQLLAPR